MTDVKLTPFPPIRYTMMELLLFDSMPKDGRKVGSADIAKARNDMGKWGIRNPLNTITTTMNRLMDKIEANDELFRIFKDGKRTGHHEVEYWVGRKPRAAAKKKKRNGK